MSFLLPPLNVLAPSLSPQPELKPQCQCRLRHRCRRLVILDCIRFEVIDSNRVGQSPEGNRTQELGDQWLIHKWGNGQNQQKCWWYAPCYPIPPHLRRLLYVYLYVHHPVCPSLPCMFVIHSPTTYVPHPAPYPWPCIYMICTIHPRCPIVNPMTVILLEVVSVACMMVHLPLCFHHLPHSTLPLCHPRFHLC